MCEMEGKGRVTRRKHKALEKERFRLQLTFCDFKICITQLHLREENCYTNSGLEQRNTEESCLRLFEKVGSLLTSISSVECNLINRRRGQVRSLEILYQCSIGED